MIEIVKGNISEMKADVIVNASNGTGFMGGLISKYFKVSGVAESLNYATKGRIEKLAKREVRKNGKYKVCDLFKTTNAGLDCKYVYHAVTMPYMGMKSNIDVVHILIKKILLEANSDHCDTVLLPLLGCGTGGLDEEAVFNIIKSELENSKITFYIVKRP